MANKPLIEEKTIPILDVDNNKREVHNIPDNEKNKNDMQ